MDARGGRASRLPPATEFGLNCAAWSGAKVPGGLAVTDAAPREVEISNR